MNTTYIANNQTYKYAPQTQRQKAQVRPDNVCDWYTRCTQKGSGKVHESPNIQ